MTTTRDEKLPHYVRTFECTKVSDGATTYHLSPKTDEALRGWALATVNDETGELAIQSDWGNWSFRWNTQHLGSPSLTHFIAGRFSGNGDCDYLADKLTSREERGHFDSYKTVEHMQRELAKARLEWGRELIDWYRYEDPEDRIDVGDDEPPRHLHKHKIWMRHIHAYEQWPLTKQIARRLFVELEELKGEDNAERFTDQFYKIDGREFISDQPWEGDHLKYTPSTGYMQLLHGILPALVRACFARVMPGRHRCEKRMGREDGAGHWRDFHRGHGCHLDDTPIPTNTNDSAQAAANAEVPQ